MDFLRKARLRRLAGGMLLWCMAGAALGADLQQCVSIALRQNPDILASQFQLAQAEAALSQAQGQRLPKLNASITATRSNDALNAFGLKLSQRNVTFNDFGLSEYTGIGTVAPTAVNEPNPVNNYNPRLELQIPLYNGGMIAGYVDQARAYVKAAQAGDQAARQRVIFQVIQAYQGAHTAHAYVNVAQQAHAAAEAYVKTTQNLLNEGVVVRSDLLFAQVNLANVQVNLEEARRGEAAAIDQLHLLLGLSLDEKLEIGPDFTPAALGGKVAELQDEAVAANPGILALRNQLDAAGAGVKVASADYYPHLNAVIRKDWNAPAFQQFASSYTVAGVLSWQIFDMGVTRGAVGRAEASRAELQARLKQAEEGVRFQVIDAWRGSAEAESRVNARTAAVAQAEEAQRLVAKRYENGVTTMVEVLAAQAQLDQARAEQVAAHYQLTMQRSALRLAVGKLDGEQL
ncbi:MAG TPA: TolC family protein [Gallionella sp.]|nr:TolC family protein [Gallionella sp.]